MGNCRFKLSDMLPNAWLYKLKDNNTKSKAQTSSKPPAPLKHSHYFTSDQISKERLSNPPIISPRTSCVHFPHPQRKFRKRSKKKMTHTISSPKLVSSSVSSACRVIPLTKDMVVDSERKSRFDPDDELDAISHLNLAPIFTKPSKFDDVILDFKKRDTKSAHVSKGYPISVKPIKEVKGPAKKSTSSCSQGLRVCVNSPRLANKKIQAYNRSSPSVTRRKSLPECFAVVKSSLDPNRDFRDSMVEMIVVNNIRAFDDLEDLLASYLSLNSIEYHDVIIKVFEQIWFDLTDIPL